MSASQTDDTVTYESMTLTWNATQRVGFLTFAGDTNVVGQHGHLIGESFGRWVGTEGVPFGFLADAKHVTGADAEYRAATAAFFKLHKRTVFIALMNLNPVVAIIAEMFRVGVGLQLKSFNSEEKARAWLRENGVPA